MNTRAKRKLTWMGFRDGLMFFSGLGAFVWQVVKGESDPWLLGAALSMMSGPAVVRSIAMAIASRGGDTTLPLSPSAPQEPASPPSSTSPSG